MQGTHADIKSRGWGGEHHVEEHQKMLLLEVLLLYL
jgi:hypothetical protein